LACPQRLWTCKYALPVNGWWHFLKRFAFELNHFDRRTRLFPKLCLGDQSDALTQIERETL
jgi:hypothetical protein